MSNVKEESNIIEMQHVNLWYDQGKLNEVHALKDVNISIKKGDYVSFFGPSGCGKTTMLYAIAGIDRYQEGKVLINDRDITAISEQELAIFRQTGIGIVFQQFNLVPSLNVIQNIALPMSFLGVSPERIEVEARMLLKRLDLEKYAERLPNELSGGQQQRVGIARALANNPPIIIADEPLGNLDSVNAKNVLAFLKELNEKDGRTIIMVTHEAWSLQDVKTIYYMKDGAVTSMEQQNPETVAKALSERLFKQMTHHQAEGDATTRVLSNFLMRGYTLEEVRRFEKLLSDRFSGTIDATEFRSGIDKPFKEGGVGLWTQKAVRISHYVEEVIDKRHDVESMLAMIEKKPEMPVSDEVFRISEWLIKEYKGKFSLFQKTALNEAIFGRIKNTMDSEGFQVCLNKPKKELGIGLSLRASQALSERLDALLLGVTKHDIAGGITPSTA